MLESAYLSKDVTAAVVQLLPVFLLALVVSEGATMNRWTRDEGMTRMARRLTRRAAIGLLAIVVFALVVEIMFLLALNDGDVHGARALLLWASAIAWLIALVLAVVVSAIPDLRGSQATPSAARAGQEAGAG
jgi:membrane protein required for beta-lactamase induction